MTKAATDKQRAENWTVQSWENFPIKQQPTYDDPAALDGALKQISEKPALVSANEVHVLRKQLAEVAEGRAFLLQGGDCAETFSEFNQDNLRSYFRVLLQMTVALMYGAGCPVVKVGRIAGQFAKPRSADMEEVGGVSLPSYRGDIVNNIEFDDNARKNNPENMIRAYNQSAATLNYLRALATGGEASLRNITRWNQDFVASSQQGKRFSAIVERINECFAFIEACGLKLDNVDQLKEADFFTSHEGLLLNYESALTRYDEKTDSWYAGSAHMLWIGERTRALDEAHVEFFRGIANPVGCKVGPTMQPDELIKLIDALNPDNIPGKLTLITRMGSNTIGDILPALARKVKEEGRSVVWSSDPMHGNTVKSPNGYKTRPFNDILNEVRTFFAVHQAEGTHAGGVHFEMTGQDVTECTGGAQAISELDLKARYHTHCDPRLNGQQSLELAFLMAEELQK